MSLPVLLAACESLRLSGSPPPAPPPVAAPAAPVVAPAAAPPRPPPMPVRKPVVPAAPATDVPPAAAGPIPVIGLNRDGLVQQFGLPRAERAAAPARVLEFGHEDCVLAAYLYFDTARNDFYTLQYEVNDQATDAPAAERCLARIRDAGRR